MQKIKIIHIITKMELGGAQIHALHICDHLDRNQFEVILAKGKGGILDKDITKTNSVTLENLKREISPLQDFKAYREIIKLLKKHNPDIVHSHSSKAGILTRMAAKKCKIISVHTVHGFSFSPLQNKLKAFIYKSIEKFASFFLSHLIFVSKYDCNTAKKMGLTQKNNYSLIPSIFNFSPFLQTYKQEKRQELKIDKDKFICGIIAPFKEQKGLFHLLEIAKLVIEKKKNTIFLLMGDGLLRAEIEAKIKEYKMENNFILPGFKRDIEKYIDIFDLALSTALWEGLPQTMVQYRLMKKAVVCSDIPGNCEVVKDNYNGFTINVYNYQDFCDKIVKIQEDGVLKNRLENADDNYEHWSAQSLMGNHEKLYLELHKRKR